MAGDDEELQILLSSFANQPITDDINQLLFSTQTNDNVYLQGGGSVGHGQVEQVFNIDPAITEILNSSADQTDYYPSSSPQSQVSNSVAMNNNKDVAMQLSVASPESGIGSDEAISPLGVDYGDNSSVRSLSNRIAFSPDNTIYSGHQQQDSMAAMLQQLSHESNELLADSENDVARFERLKNSYGRSSTVISAGQAPIIVNGVNGHMAHGTHGGTHGGVFVTGPNHRGTVYNSEQPAPAPVRRSVIVSASKPKPAPASVPVTPAIPERTYTNETFNVDFSQVSSTPVVISLPVHNDVRSPIIIDTMDDSNVDKEDEDIFKNFEISPKKDNGEYLCYVCGEKAGKHSYYGGQVCASCRAFFRRSVQSKYYEIFQCKFDKHCKITSQTRKTCQFCRFKKCLEAGMKPSWVLSDEERNRRFNKFNKLNGKNVKSANTDTTVSKKGANFVRVPEIYITFTLEEQKLIEYIKGKFDFCRQSWLRNLMMIDRNAGINFIEAAYNLAPLKQNSFRTMQKSCHIFFVTKILPNFINLDSMPTEDQAAVLQGKNSNLSHFFKISQCLKITPRLPQAPCKELCPIQRQVNEIANNNELMDSLDLSLIISKLQLAWTPKFPTYHEVFPPGWTGQREVDARHEQIMRKIQTWPFDESSQFDHTMLLLMCLVLLFSADFDTLRRSDLVENVQLKYTTLLQRYLKSKMSASAANRKFLDAIMLISWTRELWDINERYMQ